MADVNHWIGQDFGVSPSGDLASVSGFDYTSQRIVRRLMTILGQYIWELNYGGSLPIRVGQKLDVNALKSIIIAQMLLETTVLQSPAPIVTVTAILNGATINIEYVDAVTGKDGVLAFDVGQQ